MPKLLQINVDADNGSNGSIAKAIGTLALKEGWESYIAYGRNFSESDSVLMKVGSDLDVRVHGVETRLFDNHGLASRLVTKRFLKKVDAIKPDIIHLHNIHGYYINYKYLFDYIIEHAIPVVWTLHDCWTMTGHCAHFVSANCERWKTGCFSCPLRGGYPKSLFIDASKRSWEMKRKLFSLVKDMTIVPVSDWLGNFVRESFLSCHSVNVIHNGIDLNVFKPLNITKKKLGLDDRFTILGVANVWTNGKGLREFIKLSENKDFQVVMIGVSDEVTKILPDSIITISRTQNQRQLAEYYTVADVLVNPTYADTFPTVNLEALACGTPIVTYRTGGSPEAVDEFTGLVVEQGNCDALTDAITEIKTQLEKCPNERFSLEVCRRRAEICFNKDERFKDYIELYKEILSRNAK